MKYKYELALKLKEAGFKQFGDGFALILHKKLFESDETMSRICWSQYVYNPRDTEDVVVYDPTLSELIEYLGEVLLIVKEDKSFATNQSRPIMEDYIEGNSPEEAVANLILKENGLHKKTT